jgi:cytochrome c biogenesis protein CcmG/thiol:disulfide interchange protein DsbE
MGVAGVLVLAAAVLAIALSELPKGAGRGDAGTGRPVQLTRAQAQLRLADSPPVLAALHAQGGLLLEGGARAWAAQLRALRGLPVVVNKWASWCGPCQQERVVFQRVAASWGTRVAFLGIDSDDPSRSEARAFLASVPLSYPSYYDHSDALGEAVTDSSFWPVTVFFDAAGHKYIQQGPYATAAELERDIRLYAVGA